jgi:phospholipase C
LRCTGSQWTQHVVPRNPAQALTDVESCNLQAVSWVIPTAEESDHAGSNVGLGPAWVASIVNTIGRQATCRNGETYWNDTAILITWDDWGGWYDHVAPLAVDIRKRGGQPQWGDGYTYGFRVPLMVVSAYTQAGTVSNSPYDFGSMLYFIERNFGLGFIGPGTSIYSNYADYHAQDRGPLSDFFNLGNARPFVAIPTKMTAQDFIDAPPSDLPPDDD